MMRLIFICTLSVVTTQMVTGKSLPWKRITVDGVEMPGINVGHPDDNSTTVQDVMLWFSKGGRGIDTAFDYHNQNEVGQAIEKSGLKRENIFVTTKISPTVCTEANALKAVQRDLNELGLEYVDLVLHHFPCGHFVGINNEKGNVAVWKGLEEALANNLTRAIGVSNYLPADLEPLLQLKGTVPAVNQAQMSVGSHDDATIAFCDAHNITYEAYSPLRHVNLSNPTLVDIADAHSITTAQVALKWIAQQNILIATSPGADENFVVADLSLGDIDDFTDGEMNALSLISNT